MKLKIKNIQQITSMLLGKLEQWAASEIELTSDYYWDISSEELYNPYVEPKGITLGQLSDEIIEIKRLLKNDDAIAYDLKRLAVILYAISVENETAF